MKIASLIPQSVKPWLWQRLSRHMHLEYRLPTGIRAQVTSYSDWCIYNDIFVAGEYDKAIHSALDRAKPGQVFQVVDLGANAGFFSMRVIDLIERRRLSFERVQCLLVEGSPRLAPILHAHFDPVERKNLSTRIVIGLVGLRSGQAQLELTASECMNHVTASPVANSRTVPYYDLYEALDKNAAVSLLKCDIEGSEAQFIESYPELLRNTQVAAFEFHSPECPPEVGTTKVMKAGFTANHLLLDQGPIKTIFFER